MKLITWLQGFFYLFIVKTSEACSVCFFGDPTNQANVALQKGIITLLIILALVLGLFIKFFLSVGKRSQMHEGQNQ